MFEPRIYKKNGLEAFRLVGSDGSEIFYEGAIDCDESALYKDAGGRMYYQVTSRVGGPVRYYVELDPQVPVIPLEGYDNREKDTSRLVNASPRAGAALPDDIYVVPEAAPAEVPEVTTADETPVSIFERIHQKAPEEPATVPAPFPAPEEPPVIKQEASEAIHAVFAPKADPQQPPAEPDRKPPEEEAAPTGDAAKKRSLKWPAAIAIVIILAAVVLTGVYIVRPGTFDGLRSLYVHTAATPVPTATPTPEPTQAPTSTPEPTAGPDQGPAPGDISSLIDSGDPLVTAFAGAHTNATSGGTFAQVCDLFTYVNGHWNDSANYTEPRKASEILGSMEGSDRDYTVLMSALLQSLDIESRVVYSYSGDLLRYYPEVFIPNTTAASTTAAQLLSTRYGVTSPQGHHDDTGFWISLYRGDVPGTRPAGATLEYAARNGMISPIKAE